MKNYLLENSEGISKREVFERVLLSEDVVNNFLNLNFLEIEYCISYPSTFLFFFIITNSFFLYALIFVIFGIERLYFVSYE